MNGFKTASQLHAEKLRKKWNPEMTDTKCSFCNQRRLTKKVLEYSEENYGRPLCYQCQKLQKRSN